MLVGHLRIDESTKSTPLISILLGPGKLLANGVLNLSIHKCVLSERTYSLTKKFQILRRFVFSEITK